MQIKNVEIKKPISKKWAFGFNKKMVWARLVIDLPFLRIIVRNNGN